MSGVTRPRGPLPARVYWVRRLLLLAVVFAVVFGAAGLVGSGIGGNGSSATPVAADATGGTPTPEETAPPTPATPSTTGTATDAPTGTRTGTTPSGTATMQPTGSASPTDLATPTGTCDNRDIVAVPSVASPAYAARQVVVAVNLTTKETPACTWAVSPESLVVKVTQDVEGAESTPGAEQARFWTTQQCRDAVAEQSVVVRKDYPTTVAVTWSGLRSDSECTRSTSWSEPGDYHVLAAAYGADPTEVGFRLLLADRRTITRSPRPERPRDADQR